jgi:SAM-dependent methyltransferase
MPCTEPPAPSAAHPEVALAPADAALRERFGLAAAEPVLDVQAARRAGLDLQRLPFPDRQFAFVICRGVLDEVDDPLAVIRELQRTARRGQIELRARRAALLGGCAPAVQWLSEVVADTLVLQRRPFVRHPLGFAECTAALPGGDLGAGGAMLQFYWEDECRAELHDDGGYRAGDAGHRALAELDLAEAGLRWQVPELAPHLDAADRAIALAPELARAHHVRGQLLWRLDRRSEANAAFQRACRLEPGDTIHATAAALPPHRQPHLPPPPPAHPIDLAYWQLLSHDGGLDLPLLLLPPRLRQPRPPCDDARVSRFVRRYDTTTDRFVFALPSTWWSRGHEYAWAQQFAGPDHDVLDAACGVEHPLKFALAARCRSTAACDLDPRLLDPDALLAAVAASAGAAAPPADVVALLPRLHRRLASITALPYADGAFDRVFCISVLEHLTAADRAQALLEFARVLRTDGLLVLTLDHPLVDLEEFCRGAAAAGLRFAGELRRHVPPDALWSERHGLRCFRALLQKA